MMTREAEDDERWCVCVYVCVCVKEREREREKPGPALEPAQGAWCPPDVGFGFRVQWFWG